MTVYEYEASVITKSHGRREGNSLTRTLAGEENSPLNDSRRLCEVFLNAMHSNIMCSDAQMKDNVLFAYNSW